MFRAATMASLESPIRLLCVFSRPILSRILQLFYDDMLRRSPESLPGFLGEIPRELSDSERLLFD